MFQQANRIQVNAAFVCTLTLEVNFAALKSGYFV
jgi:hypothetical protein